MDRKYQRAGKEQKAKIIESGFYVYKTLDTPTRDILVYKPQTATTRREYNELRKSVKNGSGKTSYRAADLIRRFRDGNRDNSNLSGKQQREFHHDVEFNRGSLREEGNGNGGRTPENVRNDQLQEGLNADSYKPMDIDDTGHTMNKKSYINEKRTCRKLITNCMSGWQLLTTNPLTPR